MLVTLGLILRLLRKTFTPLSLLILLSSSAPAHLVLLPRLLEVLNAVEVFNSDQLPIKVLTLELVIGAKSEDALLFELSHEDFLHLTMGQLAIIVETQRLDTTLFILIELNLVLYHLHACFEDALVLNCLTNLDLASTRALTFWYRL